ncbi:hypothetical protein [Streptomyces sp. NPDC026673]|uniref:hypothetical protein n=1 Tax=Streptomyces sp. NPDC026673 TaxID=3155724 RepID=UPI0033E6901A
MPGTDQQWLADAEATYARQQEDAKAKEISDARERVNHIAWMLRQLGITPIVPASVPDGSTVVVPALLVESNPEEELYSVHADWDGEEGQIRLTLGHYWGDSEYVGQRPGRLLNTVLDVAEARREGPTSQPERKRAVIGGPTRQELRKTAEDTARYIPGDLTSRDADDIASMISGLTAAVLYLADTVTRANDRP